MNESSKFLLGLIIGLGMPLSAFAQATGGSAPANRSPASASAPTAPNTNQPKAPLAPGVNTGIRPNSPTEAPAATAPLVDPNAIERTSNCSDARFPSDTSPPCTVATPAPSADSAQPQQPR